jgi:hypothetical protein
MYARCPECLNSQQVSSKRLKKKQGMIICANCAHKFNALASLSDTPHIDKTKITSDTSEYPWQKQKTPQHILWFIGSLFGLALLALQVHYFAGYRLAQNPQIRPWLQALNKAVKYPIPTYQNLTEYSTIGSSLQRLQNNNYRLQASFINHAEFSQAPPRLQLILRNLHGGIFAQRTFSPQEYLNTSQQEALLIKQSATLDIELLLAAPKQPIGGYEIALK